MARDDKGWYELESFEGETDDAWIVWIDGEKFFMPKSQCGLDDSDEPAEILIPDWLAEREGLL